MKNYFLSAVLGIFLATGCKSSEQVATTSPSDATGARWAAGPTVSQPAAGFLVPAPAGMSNGDQRRYYAAQVAAATSAVPLKQKNSNNTTVEQQIHQGVSVGQLLGLVALAFILGAASGALVVTLRRQARLASGLAMLVLLVATSCASTRWQGQQNAKPITRITGYHE
jgi:Na+-translocating ferredoxin:NAD+ oxidoreductase RnfD subunit